MAVKFDYPTGLLEHYKPLKEIAPRLGMDHSRARKWLLDHGFEFATVRSAESHGQRTLALREEQIVAAVALRRQQGFQINGQTPSSSETQAVMPESESGWFYIVQLVPELDSRRVKLGFSRNCKLRMDDYRTACPTASLLASWPCKASWETAAIASVTRDDCERIGEEVFQCGCVESLRKRVDEFFGLMPSLIRL